MNNQHLCRGKRVDNGEEIIGGLFYAPLGNFSTFEVPFIIEKTKVYHEVDPSTIEPIRMKVNNVKYHQSNTPQKCYYSGNCPNCKKEIRKPIYPKKQNWNNCNECGTAVDWSGENER